MTADLTGMDQKFVGLYAQLLMRYLRVPADALITSLHVAGIEFDMQAKPVFVDARSARMPSWPLRPMTGVTD